MNLDGRSFVVGGLLGSSDDVCARWNAPVAYRGELAHHAYYGTVVTDHHSAYLGAQTHEQLCRAVRFRRND